jgi:hypothetical protein
MLSIEISKLGFHFKGVSILFATFASVLTAGAASSCFPSPVGHQRMYAIR